MFYLHMHSFLSPFALSEHNRLEDNVYIKKFKQEQYLVISKLTFELNTQCHSPFLSTCLLADEYCVHPDTLQCGYILNGFLGNTQRASYLFRTTDHFFNEQKLEDLHRKILGVGYLRIGRIMVHGQPHSDLLSEADMLVIRQALNWFVKESNKENNKRKFDDSFCGYSDHPNKKPRIDELDYNDQDELNELDDSNDKFFDTMMNEPNLYPYFKNRIAKEKEKEERIKQIAFSRLLFDSPNPLPEHVIHNILVTLPQRFKWNDLYYPLWVIIATKHFDKQNKKFDSKSFGTIHDLIEVRGYIKLMHESGYTLNDMITDFESFNIASHFLDQIKIYL